MSAMSARFRPLAIAAGLLAAVSSAHAQSAGDLMFTSLNADEDGWTMVALANLPANTTVFFNDNEWNGSAIGSGGAFNTGESAFQWVSGASVINAGTVIRFSATDAPTRAASIGTFTAVNTANLGLSATADTVYAYLGTSLTAPTTFLTAVTNTATVVESNLAGTGLSYGTNATQLVSSADFGEYTGVRSGLQTFGAYRPLVADTANWVMDTTNGNYALTVPNTTNFSVQPIPEPSELAIMMAGFGLAGLIARRRRSAR
jgi:hypothetical protein